MWVETQPSAQPPFQKLNVNSSCQKTRKIRYSIFEVLSNLIAFLYFVTNILPRIVVFKLLSRKVLFIKIKDIRNCQKVDYFLRK